MTYNDNDYQSFSIFDLMKKHTISEAGEDDAQGGGGQPAPPNGQQNQNNQSGGDDDFDIDTSLDNDQDNQDSNNDSDNQDSTNSADTDSTDDASMDNTGEEDEGDEEAVETNSDMFLSLSKEEQQIKIKELKSLYGNLYSSCNDILNRIDTLDANELSIESITKITTALVGVRNYMADYIANIFSTKSFVENDIMFNRFLDIINTIKVSFEKIYNSNKQTFNHSIDDNIYIDL